MDANFLNYTLPQLNLNPFTAQYNLSQINANSIAFQLTPSVEISTGFRGTNPLSWRLSIDQHTLRFYISEQLTSTGTIQYVLSLVGDLFYNVALLGLQPIDPVCNDSNVPIAFTNSGSQRVNYVVGTFDSIAEIQSSILTNFSITASLDDFYIVSETGEAISYNPSDPSTFIGLLTGERPITVYSQITIIITFSCPPIS